MSHEKNPHLLTDDEFSLMMSEFAQASEWMIKQLNAPETTSMEQHVVDLGQHNLAELEVVERLVVSIGVEAFEMEVQRLAGLHTVDVQAPIQSVARYHHPSVIGVSDVPFDVLSRVCEQLVVREPELLQHPSYQCRNEERIALPLTLWLDLVRYARECFDPAALDADFLSAKMREGLSSEEAFHALIASKRVK